MERLRHPLSRFAVSNLPLCSSGCGFKWTVHVVGIWTILLGIIYSLLGALKCGGGFYFHVPVSCIYLSLGIWLMIGGCTGSRPLLLVFAWGMLVVLFTPLISFIFLLVDTECLARFDTRSLVFVITSYGVVCLSVVVCDVLLVLVLLGQVYPVLEDSVTAEPARRDTEIRV